MKVIKAVALIICWLAELVLIGLLATQYIKIPLRYIVVSINAFFIAIPMTNNLLHILKD